MIPFSLYKVMEVMKVSLKLWSKVLHIILIFTLYFSSLNLKYLKFIKMDLTRFAMKLFISITHEELEGWKILIY